MKSALLFLAIVMGLSLSSRAQPTAPKEKFHLYILAGQSNMAGRGTVEEQDKTPHPRVFVLTKELQWKPATDPLHFDKPKVAGVGPGLTFGKTMAEADPSAVIGLIPCAVGGTSLDKWQPGALDEATKTHPYDDAMVRIKRAMQDGTLKGLLWHQGEGDSNEKAASKYGNALEQTLGRWRDVLGQDDLPIVVGRLAPFFTARSQHAQQVDRELEGFSKRLAYVGVAGAQGLNHRGDNTHFDSASARELGRRYAQEMLRVAALPKPTVVKVWPQGLPDGKPLPKPEEKAVARVKQVSEPELQIYPPAKQKATGTAVVICPGGGYNIIAIEKEGDCVARWLNDIGVAAFVLKYRLKEYPQPSPILDAQQAIRIIRQRAAEWGVNPAHVGIMGFSAGAHLAAATSNAAPVPFTDARYKSSESIDCRPNFSLLIYGVLPQKGDPWVKQMYSAIELSPKTPPAFLVHAKDDRIPCQLSADYAAKCKELGVPAELHLFETGGHGYGLGQSGGDVATWPELCAKWLKARGM